MAKLTVIEGPDVGNEYELEDDMSPLTVGRDPETGLPLEDTAISRRHFRLEVAAGAWGTRYLHARLEPGVSVAEFQQRVEAAASDGSAVVVYSVGALQAVLAVTGYCLGCRLYFLKWWVPAQFQKLARRTTLA